MKMKMKNLIYLGIFGVFFNSFWIAILLLVVTYSITITFSNAIFFEGYWGWTFLGFVIMGVLLQILKILGETGRIMLEELDRLK